MDLLNGWVVLAIVSASLALAVLGFVFVRRPGGGKARMAGRIVTIIGAQLCVLIAIGALINYQFAYFRNQSEMWQFVTHQGQVGHVDQIQSPPAPQTPQDLSDPRYHYTWEESSDEGMTGATIVGPQSGITSDMRAWVPRGYPEEGVKYNVMLLLPGTPGSADAIAPAIGAPEALQKAIDEGKIPPTILVTSDMNFGGQTATCADVEGGLKAETWFSRDLPLVVRANFNVTDSPEGWTVVGPSMGGYCAGRIGILHPDVFGNAVWMHGVNEPFEGPLAEVPAVRKAQALSTLASKAQSQVNLMLVSSMVDPGTIEDGRAIAAAVQDKGKVLVDERPTGGHGWAVWINEFPSVLTWLATIHPVK